MTTIINLASKHISPTNYTMSVVLDFKILYLNPIINITLVILQMQLIHCNSRSVRIRQFDKPGLRRRRTFFKNK